MKASVLAGVFASLVTFLASGTSHVTASQFQNTSTRAAVLTDDSVLICGFIISGTEPKKVMLRALGLSLPFTDSVPPLADPILQLHEPDGTVITNDNWRDTQGQEVMNTGIPPMNDLDSAIVVTLPPGAYTAIVRGKGNTIGTALVEVYDLDEAANSELANISARGYVGAEDNVMIAGIIVGPDGSGESTVVVRGIGPSLGVFTPPASALPNPLIELYDSDGDIIALNDNWMDDPHAAEIAAAGLAPDSNLEAALQATLAPGAYTAILRGTGIEVDLTGIGLIESYNIK